MIRGDLPPLTVHLGLPKCASSSLQRFFPDAAMAHFYMGKFKRNEQGLAYHTAEIETLFRREIGLACEVNFNYTAARETLDQYFCEFNSERRPVLLSEEVMSGFGFITHHKNHHLDPYIILHRLKTLFPTLRIVLIIREQFKLLQSYYSELLVQGYNIAYDQFVRKQLTEAKGLHNILKYGEYVSFLERQCDELVVIPFESLVKKDKFSVDAWEKLNISYNCILPHTRNTPSNAELHRLFCKNIQQTSRLGALQSIYDLSRTQALIEDQKILATPERLFWLEPQLQQDAMLIFQSANKQLSQRLGLELASYGYFT